ncbi:MAG: cation diffusion facilitator family transporter [Ilumatobacteraceae bacterium]
MSPDHDHDHSAPGAANGGHSNGGHSNGGHSHGGHPHGGGEPVAKTVGIAFAANTALLVVQLIGGLIAGSLALVGDSAHQATDVISLAMVLVGLQLRKKPADRIHSFGRKRTDAVVAQISAVTLIAASTWIVIEAVGRFRNPEPIEGWVVLVLASVGLLVNGGSAFLLHRDNSSSLLSRAAIAHLIADAAGSAAVMVVGFVVTVTDWTTIDAIVSILLAVVIGYGAWGLARDATKLLLDIAPDEVDLDEVAAWITDQPHVEAVHHLHVWRIDDSDIALSSHLVMAPTTPDVMPTIHESQQIVQVVSDGLQERFGITHATIQVECHECEQPAHP